MTLFNCSKFWMGSPIRMSFIETLFDSWQVHTDYYLQVVMVITSKISMKVVLDILMADTKTCGKIDGPLQCILSARAKYVYNITFLMIFFVLCLFSFHKFQNVYRTYINRKYSTWNKCVLQKNVWVF